ncbi:hypothetical protein E4J89_15085 [Arthrobacter sp. CAU 1506]|uniref:hypothetical protein n=1 Tax=Arthrobacter sp. CAU 1506 TaxID=2560052 RepID=UPI0010AC167A|nr:hypothetical protein [Arthrobacter sp. CAU 1506]TJY67408.1 hypothetical protein E4J89_15085 [Arthrobacter sp. CAU 1506]
MQHPIRRRAVLGMMLAAVPCAAAADIAGHPPVPAVARLAHPSRPGGHTMACWGSSTAEGMSPELAQLASAYGMTYFNGGAGGQTAEQILARIGARPARVAASVIPASGAAVLSSPSMSAMDAASFSAAGDLAGIPGKLSKAHGAQPGYRFHRRRPGTSVRMPDGTPFLPTEGGDFRAGISHLSIGKNNLTGKHHAASDPDTIVEWTHAADTWLTAAGGHVLVWGHFVNTGTHASAPVRRRIYRVNAALSIRYGPRYLDLDRLLTHRGIWEMAGIRPTASDLREQAKGNKPPSLSSNGAHLNALGYAVLRRVIESKLENLGWLPHPQR